MPKHRDGIHDAVRAGVWTSVKSLGERQAPTRFGYNDMAVLIAYGYSDEEGTPTVSAEMISEFLNRHPTVPDYAKLNREQVQLYLDELAKVTMLERRGNGYRMREDISFPILERLEELKSPELNDEMLAGFKLHSAWQIEIDRERTAGTYTSSGDGPPQGDAVDYVNSPEVQKLMEELLKRK